MAESSERRVLSVRVVVQHIWIGHGKSRRPQYRLVIYGDRQVHGDFDSLAQIERLVRSAAIPVNLEQALDPDPIGPSILFSRSLDLDEGQLIAIERLVPQRAST